MPLAYIASSAAFVNNADATATTIAVTLGAAVAIGDYIVGMAGCDPTGTPTFTVADTLSNTYTVQANSVTSGQKGQTFFARVTTAGTPTITVTISESESFRRVIVAAYSGLADASVADGTVGNGQASPGTGANAVTSTAITTTVNGDLLVAFHQNTGEAAPGTGTISAGTNFTRRDTANAILAVEDLIQAAAGSIAGTFTISNNHDSVTHVSAFKAATGGDVTLALSGSAGTSGHGTSVPNFEIPL